MADKPAGPVPVSDVLTNPRTTSELTQDARDAIRAGLTKTRYTPHAGCPCERCARAFGIIP